MAVNLKGPFLMARAVRPWMVKAGGHIVNIASATVLSGTPLWAQYAASKGGVIALTRVLANELGAYGITVNAIAPGLTLTDGLPGFLRPSALRCCCFSASMRRSSSAASLASASSAAIASWIFASRFALSLAQSGISSPRFAVV